MRIIKSLLDTDLYKLTMQQFAVTKKKSPVEYKLYLRNYDSSILVKLKDEIQEQINKLCELKFEKDELIYLNDKILFPYFKESYIKQLESFRLNPKHISINTKDNKFDLRIKGSWFDTILFETPILAIISELAYQDTEEMKEQYKREGIVRLLKGIKYCEEKELRFYDFGTRRRYSYEWHLTCLKNAKDANVLKGTSNLHFGKELNIPVGGTMAHELIEFYQGPYSLSPLLSQNLALFEWIQFYKGRLGVALSDTLGTEKFFKDFDWRMAKLYDGTRQDSGNAFEYGKKIYFHYLETGINPETKTVMFSDGLDFNKAYFLKCCFDNVFKSVDFGIGTFFTNNMGFVPMQLVIKMIKSCGKPVIKISDTPTKTVCENESYRKKIISLLEKEKLQCLKK